ncbi:DUF2163 domain-containing protein [Thermaurantiacus sp.]
MTDRLFPGGVGTICLCWKIMRLDGLTLGFTSHDRPLVLDGLTYEPVCGMTPSAILTSASFEADSMAIDGFLHSDRISEADLRAGRWDGATLQVFACDWHRPERPPIFLARGLVGDVRQTGLGAGGQFRMELLSPFVALARRQALAVSPTCRAELGDLVCGVDMAGRALDVDAVARGRRLVEAADPIADSSRFVLGKMRVIGGRLAGLDGTVVQVDGREITLAMRADLALGEQLRLRLFEGCDKTLSTCSGRFGNAAAFAGEPHLPGNDALVRYGVG